MYQTCCTFMAINTNCDELATPCLFLQPPYQLCDPYIRCSFRAKHHNTAETLLAVIAAFSAKFIVGNAIPFIQKQRPLLFPLLAHSRHSNQSSFPAENIKTQGRYIQPCLFHFPGRKTG